MFTQTLTQEPTRPWKGLLSAIAVASIVGLVAAGRAEAVPLTAVDAGFVTELGGSAKGDGTLVPSATYNYSVGLEVHYTGGFLSPPPFAPMDRNNYFVFDSSGLSGTLVGASLEVYAGMFESVHMSEIFDVVAPSDPGAAIADADALLTGNSVGSTEFDDALDPLISVASALYGNIESGPAILGSAVVSSDDDGTTLSIPIVDLGYLSAHLGGPIFLGGTVSGIIPADGTPQQPFGFTGPDIPGGDPLTPTLILTFASTSVPEPSTLALGAIVLAAICMARRRRDGAALGPG